MVGPVEGAHPDVCSLRSARRRQINAVFSPLAGKQDATIIGGHKVKNHSRPYMGFLENEYREVLCDGFLIQPEWVMTAAHCNDSRWVP